MRRTGRAALAITLALLVACSGPVPLDLLLDRGPALRVHAGQPQTLDPALVGDSVSWSYLIQIHSGLVRLDENLNTVPDLAERWDVSPDGATYTFTLRPGVKFHSGREIVADDFVYAIERALDPATGSTTAQSYLGDIADVSAVDPRTLEIRLDAPKSYFLAKLTHPIAYPLDRANVESGERWFEKPNGSGPFRLGSWERETKLTLLRFNEYWAGPAKVRQIDFDFSPLPGIVLYERGDVDVTEVDIGSLDRVAESRNPTSRDLVVAPLLSTWYVGFNAQAPPFDDPLVRRAFAHSTDRERLVRVFYRETRAAADSILPPGLPGYDAEIQAPALDVPRARQLLAQSRYAGRLPEIMLSVGTGSGPTGEAIAEMYARNLGVDVGVREWGDEFPVMLERRQTQMFLTGWIADYPHPENFLDILFHSRSTGNYGGFADPRLDQLLEGARVERDEARRREGYARAERVILDEAAAVPVHHETVRALVRPWVRGLVWTPLGILSYRDVEVGERTVERPAACAPAPRWQGLAKIGLILPFHGPAPREAEATHVAVRDVLLARNRAGGLRGRRLELVSLDSWSDPATARARAAELLADPLVVAALVGSTVGEALSDLAARGLPTVSVGDAAGARAAAEQLLARIDAGRP